MKAGQTWSKTAFQMCTALDLGSSGVPSRATRERALGLKPRLVRCTAAHGGWIMNSFLKGMVGAADSGAALQTHIRVGYNSTKHAPPLLAGVLRSVLQTYPGSWRCRQKVPEVRKSAPACQGLTHLKKPI